MRQYFTYINLKNPNGTGKVPIEYHIKESIQGIEYTSNFAVCTGSRIGDPRTLGYIDLVPDGNGDIAVTHYPTGKKPVQDVMDMIFSLFYIPATLETVVEAQDKILRWINRTDININGDNLIFPGITINSNIINLSTHESVTDINLFSRNLMFMTNIELYDNTSTLITNDNIASFITFKNDNIDGTDVSFSAIINEDKEIVVTPSSALVSGDYYIALNEVQDLNGTVSHLTYINFTIS